MNSRNKMKRRVYVKRAMWCRSGVKRAAKSSREPVGVGLSAWRKSPVAVMVAGTRTETS